MKKNIISVSGGKDSTALWLLAIERNTENIEVVFADTGHEHAQTYDYVKYLGDTLGPITVVKADFSRNIEVRRKNLRDKWEKDGVSEDRIETVLENLHPTGNPFLDLCMLKGRFPSTRARFCSQELKQRPIRDGVVMPLINEGHQVVSWQGVRADESPSRAKLTEFEDQAEPRLSVYRPILKWTAEDVFAFHRKHGVKHNPLYEQGMGRVGCMPCIHCSKSELREISARFPDEIARVAKWEKVVADCSKRGLSTFFSADKTPEGRAAKDNHEKLAATSEIYQVVEWSKTVRGGKLYDIFDQPEPEMCSSAYGLCE